MKSKLQRALSRRITTNIKAILSRKNLRQEHIHLNSDLDKGNLSRYFSGTRDYTLLSLQRIAEALEVDVSVLVNLPGSGEPDFSTKKNNGHKIVTRRRTESRNAAEPISPGSPARLRRQNQSED